MNVESSRQSGPGERAAGRGRARAIAAVSEPLPVVGDGGVKHRIAVGMGFDLNPFVALAHDVIPPTSGFAMHPHRGIEIVTYLWQGGLRHQDSAGYAATLEPGGLMRIFTGRGVSHSELPVGDADTLGLQLWLTISAADRRLEPEFQLLRPAEVPEVAVGDARVRLLAGTLAGHSSPLTLHNPTLYLDVALPAAGTATLPVPADFAAFLYVLEGRGRFGDPEVAAGAYQRLVLGAGESLHATADGEPLRYVLLAGRPIAD
ncbi:MAG: pirin family protein [Chloroflexota bacterium]